MHTEVEAYWSVQMISHALTVVVLLIVGFGWVFTAFGLGKTERFGPMPEWVARAAISRTAKAVHLLAAVFAVAVGVYASSRLFLSLVHGIVVGWPLGLLWAARRAGTMQALPTTSGGAADDAVGWTDTANGLANELGVPVITAVLPPLPKHVNAAWTALCILAGLIVGWALALLR